MQFDITPNVTAEGIHCLLCLWSGLLHPEIARVKSHAHEQTFILKFSLTHTPHAVHAHHARRSQGIASSKGLLLKRTSYFNDALYLRKVSGEDRTIASWHTPVYLSVTSHGFATPIDSIFENIAWSSETMNATASMQQHVVAVMLATWP